MELTVDRSHRGALLAVTDDEGCHPFGSVPRTAELSHVRPRETLLDLRPWGGCTPRVARLGLPDGGVAEHEDRPLGALGNRANKDDLRLAPGRRDGHPNHPAWGRPTGATSAQLGARSQRYLIWADHWADPAEADLPWEQRRRFDLDSPPLERNRWSREALGPQIRPLGLASGYVLVLSPPMRERFHWSYEAFVEEGPSW